ncbi:MAG TPA: Mrp/NBP35 family ATP-binding protein [Phycisphaerales bacterium]|nr:Mrp/NBP35 family ATP-binding protein [Phycisphaerales bacterium]HMP38098.1 Mrp/NBP35 family ATP-binding protein [Phycisphaerales bacterium]
MPLSDKDLHAALRTVREPDHAPSAESDGGQPGSAGAAPRSAPAPGGRDIVALGLVAEAALDGERIALTIELPAAAMRHRDRLRAEIEAACRARAAEIGTTLQRLEIRFAEAPPSTAAQTRAAGSPLPRVREVIAVGAGKGGVGKSTVATLLAVGLARRGERIGLLDADIYGPSMPTMLGLGGLPVTARGPDLLAPFEIHGIKAMTIGRLVDPEKALIWRGPMAHGAFKQLATQTDWGALDRLIVDLPPGTGDVPLTMAQLLPVTGAVVVCTPQRVAQDDARRAVRMFQQLGIEVFGVVENMSWFVGDDGKAYDLFGRGGAELMAQELGIPFLGALPITMGLRRNCDDGTPLANWEEPGELPRRIDALCDNLVGRVALAALARDAQRPTLSVR